MSYPANRMSDADYERERAALREAYGDKAGEAKVKAEQALARLFYRSGWTQEELAKKEGCKPKTIERQLRFGRFLDFVKFDETLKTLPGNLGRGQFNTLWERTEKHNGNERIRFQAVLRLIEEELVVAKPRSRAIAGDLVKKFADGKWHSAETMAKHLDVPPERVFDTFRYLNEQQNGKFKQERKKVGTSWSGRIFPIRKDRAVSPVELAEKLGPILEGLEAEGKKTSMAQVSIPTIAYLAGKLRQLIEEWEK